MTFIIAGGENTEKTTDLKCVIRGLQLIVHGSRLVRLQKIESQKARRLGGGGTANFLASQPFNRLSLRYQIPLHKFCDVQGLHLFLFAQLFHAVLDHRHAEGASHRHA